MVKRSSRAYPSPKGITWAHYGLFGGGIPPLLTQPSEEGSRLWARRVAVAMILGVCPLMMVFFQDLDEGEFLAFLSSEQYPQELLRERLNASVETLLSV